MENRRWHLAPDVVLEEIFSLLTIPQRYNCSMVCRHWYEIFFSPRLWRHLLLNERSFTHRKFTPYKGYWYEVNHGRLQAYLGAVGHYSRCITFAPISNFFNLYTHLEILTCFLRFFEEYPMPYLEQFDFTFACETPGTESFITGTGGQILAELKKLLGSLQGLVKLRLRNLLLELSDAPSLLDEVVENCSDTLRELEVLNCTKKMFPLMAVTKFNALRTLVLSPRHLSRSLLLELVTKTPSTLELLAIVQDRYTKLNGCDDDDDDDPTAVDEHTWIQVRQTAPRLRVRLECRGVTANDVAVQEGAPVTAVVYSTPTFKVALNSVIQIIDSYRYSLKVYAHLGLPRTWQPRAFPDRADTLLVLLVRECPNLETLVVRDRVSTATLLVIRSDAPNSLRTLLVRRKGVRLRCDWPKSTDWTDEYYERFRMTSRSYDDVEKELKKRFGQRWKMLSDREFKRIKIVT